MDEYEVRDINDAYQWIVVHVASGRIVAHCDTQDQATLVCHALNAYVAGSKRE